MPNRRTYLPGYCTPRLQKLLKRRFILPSLSDNCLELLQRVYLFVCT